MSGFLAAGRVADIGPVEPVGGLMVSLQIDGRRAVVIGGGPVAAQRARLLRAAGAAVVVVAPRLNAELQARVERGELAWEAREVEEGDIHGAVVMAAVDDRVVSERVAGWARARQIPVNVADEPTWCDFYVPAVHRDGPVQIAVSTGGEGPGMAARVRDALAAALPAGLGEAVRRFGALRRAVRAHDPAPEASARRMGFLRPIGASWPLPALAEMDVGAVLARYPEEVVEPIAAGDEPRPAALTPPALQPDLMGAPTAARADLPAEAGTVVAHPSSALQPRPWAEDVGAECGGQSAQPAARHPGAPMGRRTWDLADAERWWSHLQAHGRGGELSAYAAAGRARRLPTLAMVGDGGQSVRNVGEPETRRRVDAAPRGLVQLVGAGPGDPELLTLAALRALQSADLVLSDRLVPPEVRALARGEVRVAGKEAGLADEAQAELDRLAVTAARAGRRVVRLKIGDPGLFGRLGEEMDTYAAAGVAYEVIPGISSAHAAPLVAGVPLTLRGVADRVVVASGHAAGDGVGTATSWEPRTTWVFLMAVGRLEALVGELLAAGFSPDLPACTVESASLPGERVTRAGLARLPAAARAAGVRAPAVVIVGEVVARAPAERTSRCEARAS